MTLLQLEAAVEHERTKRVVFYEHLLLHGVMTMHAVTGANDTIDWLQRVAFGKVQNYSKGIDFEACWEIELSGVPLGSDMILIPPA